MYKFQSYYYINRITNELRQFRNERDIPEEYRSKIIDIDLDVTYNSNGYIDKKSERMVANSMVKAQKKAPQIAYLKVCFKENENESDDSDDSRDSFDSDAAWNERAEPMDGRTVRLVDPETDEEEEAEEEEEEENAEDEEEEEEGLTAEEESADEEYDDSADDGVVIPNVRVIDDNLSLY